MLFRFTQRLGLLLELVPRDTFHKEVKGEVITSEQVRDRMREGWEI